MKSHSLLTDLEEDRYRKVKTEQWETLLDGSFSSLPKAHLILACMILQMLLWYTPPSLPLYRVLPMKTENSSEPKT